MYERRLTKIYGYRLVPLCAGGLDMSLPRPGLFSNPGQRVLSTMIDYVTAIDGFLARGGTTSYRTACAEVVAETADQGQRS